MKVDKSGMFIDNPASKLLDFVCSYEGITTADGNAAGTSIVCEGLTVEPSYDGLLVKMLTGTAAGETRVINIHAAGSNTLVVNSAFLGPTGAAVQIVSGTRFVVLSLPGGSGGGPPAPSDGLFYFGVVTAVPGANQFTIDTLAGLGAGKFAGATNPYWAFVLRDSAGASGAPQGEQQAVTAYVNASGTFTTAAYTAAVAVGDEVLIIHPAIANVLVLLADLAVPAVDSAANVLERDVIGNKGDAPKLVEGDVYSLIAYAKALVVNYTGAPIVYTDANTFTCDALVGIQNTSLVGWWVQCVWDSGGAGAAPQGEWRQVATYVSATGTITHAAFSANMATGDKIKVVPPEVYEALTIRGGANSIQSVMDELAAMLDLARSADSGSLLMTGAEQTLYEETDTSPFNFPGGVIDLSVLQAGDTVTIKVYVINISAGTYRQISDNTVNTYSGVQAIPAKQITLYDMYNMYGVKVTITQSAGTYRTINHEWYDAKRGT